MVFLKDGTVDFSYTGLAQNENGIFWMKAGGFDTEMTGVVPDTIGVTKDGSGWLYLHGGIFHQTLSVFTLWTLTVYLVQQKKPFVMTLVPALFMTVICSTFLLISPTALALSESLAYTGSVIILVLDLVKNRDSSMFESIVGAGDLDNYVPQITKILEEK